MTDLHTTLRRLLRIGSSLVGAVAIAGLVIGCGDGKEAERPGSVTVSWGIGGSTCQKVGVDLVRVSLISGDKVEPATPVPCQQGTMRITSVAPGNYLVQVDGYTKSSDTASYYGKLAGVGIQAGQETKLPRIDMEQKPGAFDITWKFATGDLCSFAGVDTVAIRVWDDRSRKVYNEYLACDPFLAVSQQEAKNPTTQLWDTARGVVVPDLLSGVYNVEIFALMAGTGSNMARYWAKAEAGILNGRLTAVPLTLAACNDAPACLIGAP